MKLFSEITVLLCMCSTCIFANNDLPFPSPALMGSVSDTFALMAINDNTRIAMGEPDKAWPGQADFPKRPLYGITYYPWRTTVDCDNVTEQDVESDIRLLSTLAGSLYVYELYCGLGPALVKLTRRYNMTILLGITLKNDTEYMRQRDVLKSIFAAHSATNLSHVVAVTVGHNELPSVMVPDDDDNKEAVRNQTRNSGMVVSRLREIIAIVDNSSYPDIPVATSDNYEAIFRSHFNRQGQAFVVSVSAAELRRRVAQQAASLLYDKVIVVRNAAEADDDQKPIILTDVGWPSGGVDTLEMRNPNRTIEPNEQLEFLYRLHCPGPDLRAPPMYYVSTAFDTTWKDPAGNSSAHWGLADAVTRTLKLKVWDALRASCTIDKAPNFIQDTGKTDREHRRSLAPVLFGVGAAVIVIFVVMLIMVVCLYRRKRDAVRKLKTTQRRLEDARNSSLVISDTGESAGRKSTVNSSGRWDDYLSMLEPEYEDLSYMVAPELRIDPSSLELKEIVGQGHFGLVQRAMLFQKNTATDVAVKRLHVGARNVNQFLLEGIHMQKFNHRNILNLIGISFTPTNLPMIITPFMVRGDVLNFVKSNKQVPLRQLIDLFSQIAEGMRYLHQLKMIHRDLAARNCMLDEYLTVKIADFGLCRDISDSDSYQSTKAFELPIRWMPPEAIEKLRWTNKSDVWSYGVVIWEIFSRGQQPYADRPLIELRAFLHSGGRLARPDGCPDIVFEIMNACWRYKSNARPNFDDLCECIAVLIRHLDEGKSLDSNVFYGALPLAIMSRRLTVESEQQSVPVTPMAAAARRLTIFRGGLRSSAPIRPLGLHKLRNPKKRKSSLP